MKNGILKQVTELQSLALPELRERWRELYGTEPPAYRRDQLVKRLAYRVQELAYGGVSEATRAELRESLNGERLDADATTVTRLKRRNSAHGAPVVGTRLVREWRGRRYEVTVVEGGYEFNGQRYRSLSAVAKVITRAHWNVLKPALSRS